MNADHAKVAVVGDSNVGKTTLISAITRRSVLPPKDGYMPTVFDNQTLDVSEYVNKRTVLELWDTAGRSEYDRLRPLSYPQTDLFIACFSISNLESWENIRNRWIPEILHYGGEDAKILLVGTILSEKSLSEPRRNVEEIVHEQEAKEIIRTYDNLEAFVKVKLSQIQDVKLVFEIAARICFERKLLRVGLFVNVQRNDFWEKCVILRMDEQNATVRLIKDETTILSPIIDVKRMKYRDWMKIFFSEYDPYNYELSERTIEEIARFLDYN